MEITPFKITNKYHTYQKIAPRSAALIEFGEPHSPDPDRPGAHHIAPINHAITSSGDHSRSDTHAAMAGLVRRAR
jgi:hypothetical protein